MWGTAVLLPEYLSDRLPIAGRGTAIFEVVIRRAGEPVHEVLRPSDLPDVIGTGAELVLKLRKLDDKLKATAHRYAEVDSVFIGKFTAGEIYNKSPVECRLNGTRRWITPGTAKAVREEFQTILDQLAAASRTIISLDFVVYGDAFHIDPTDAIVNLISGRSHGRFRPTSSPGRKTHLGRRQLIFHRGGNTADHSRSKRQGGSHPERMGPG